MDADQILRYRPTGCVGVGERDIAVMNVSESCVS